MIIYLSIYLFIYLSLLNSVLICFAFLFQDLIFFYVNEYFLTLAGKCSTYRHQVNDTILTGSRMLGGRVLFPAGQIVSLLGEGFVAPNSIQGLLLELVVLSVTFSLVSRIFHITTRDFYESAALSFYFFI